MKTRALLLATVLWLSSADGAASATNAVVLAAAATSSAPGAASATCLLDPGCQGVWSPGAADHGTDEGIYVQFEKPTPIHYLQVTLEGLPDALAARSHYELYLNGRTRNSRGPYVAGEASFPAAPGVLVFGVGNTADPGIDPLQETVRSMFLKLNPRSAGSLPPPRIKRIAFLAADHAALPLALPTLLPATVTATSVLEPISAYHPANLFDSRYDFAWSTDGKKTTGTGESVTLTFTSPQTVSGLLVWNGYQRSPEHFKANGRVRTLEVVANAQSPQTVGLLDQTGSQLIRLTPPLTGARQIKFAIRETVAGASYKDVLISELRLVGTNGALLLPQTELPKTAAPTTFQGLIDRSFASILHQPVWGDSLALDEQGYRLSKQCDNARIRVRGNGTFVIYKDFNYGTADSAQRPANINANVVEGNWEPKGGTLRIFGRKYVTALRQSEYGGTSAPATARTEIFQSELSIKPYNGLTAQEKATLFAYLWQKKHGPTTKAQKFLWVIGKDDQWIEGANYEDLVKKMDAALLSLNPYYLQSSVLNDLVLPSDAVSACFSSAS
ncbi:MAG: hypothetical protein HY696_00235 [Deltaproteobacteria bacterium]|nr:hypothetical protein [Deltaproteobacteria bacterium]